MTRADREAKRSAEQFVGNTKMFGRGVSRKSRQWNLQVTLNIQHGSRRNGMPQAPIIKTFETPFTGTFEQAQRALREFEVKKRERGSDGEEGGKEWSWDANVTTLEAKLIELHPGTSRALRHCPMLRACAIQLPNIKTYNPINMTLMGNATCVPVAVTHWLRSDDKNGNLRIPQTAVDMYSEALQPFISYDRQRRPSKPHVTIESITALLNAIHAKSEFPDDRGHSCADLLALCKLFEKSFTALTERRAIIERYVSPRDGNSHAHNPLYITMAQGHLYLHLDKDVIKSIREIGAQKHGSRAMKTDAINEKKSTFTALCVTQYFFIEEAEPNTVYLIRGASDVDDYFKEAWNRTGISEAYKPIKEKVRGLRVVRFTLTLGDGKEAVIGADPHYNDRDGIDHDALYEAICAAATAQGKDAPSPLCMLDGFGAQVSNSFPKPQRKKRTKAERQQVLEEYGCKCAMCKTSIEERDKWELDHKIALADGGPDTLDNSQPLCEACHADKSIDENERGYLGKEKF